LVGHVRGDLDELAVGFAGVVELTLTIDIRPRAMTAADVHEDRFPPREPLGPRETRIVGFGTKGREGEDVFDVFEFHEF